MFESGQEEAQSEIKDLKLSSRSKISNESSSCLHSNLLGSIHISIRNWDVRRRIGVYGGVLEHIGAY